MHTDVRVNTYRCTVYMPRGLGPRRFMITSYHNTTKGLLHHTAAVPRRHMCYDRPSGIYSRIGSARHARAVSRNVPERRRYLTSMRCNLIDMAFLGHDFCAHWLFAASEGMSPSRSHRRLFPDIRLTDYQYDSAELPMNESRPRPDYYWAPSETTPVPSPIDRRTGEVVDAPPEISSTE